MHFYLNRHASRDFEKLPIRLQLQADRQFGRLCNNLLHSSLRAKKYDESKGVWQARVNRDYRFYFVVKRDAYVIISITKHPK